MRLIAPFLLMLMSLGLAQAADVRVYVFDGDEGHRPLPGISVSVNDVSVGTTNADGRVVTTQAPGRSRSSSSHHPQRPTGCGSGNRG